MKESIVERIHGLQKRKQGNIAEMPLWRKEKTNQTWELNRLSWPPMWVVMAGGSIVPWRPYEFYTKYYSLMLHTTRMKSLSFSKFLVGKWSWKWWKCKCLQFLRKKKSWRSVRRTRTRSVVSTVHHLDHYLTDEGMFNWSQNIATNLTVKRS